MLYIYCEDETSGYDFIKTLVRRVWNKTDNVCLIDKLCGAGKCNKFLRDSIEGFRINKSIYFDGDSIILFFDKATLDLTYLFAFIEEAEKKGISVYLQSFYCFESAFFTYNEFIGNCTYFFGLINRL